MFKDYIRYTLFALSSHLHHSEFLQKIENTRRESIQRFEKIKKRRASEGPLTKQQENELWEQIDYETASREWGLLNILVHGEIGDEGTYIDKI